MKKFIVCTLIKEGIHNWPDIPDTLLLEDVQYLKDFHRHNFRFKCVLKVNHNNRDVEFINLKHQIDEYLEEKYYNSKYRCLFLNNRSCEMIAEELIENFHLHRCEVFEDGENGCILEIEHD